MTVAQWWQKPTNNPNNKKNPNKSKSNNGKKKVQEKESEEKLAVAIAMELDGLTMGSYAEFVGGFDLGIGLLWCETMFHKWHSVVL